MRVHVEVLGDVVLSRTFLRVGENATDLRPALAAIFRDWEDRVDKQFSSEGSAMGTPWEPLADSTLAQKAAGGYPPDILIRTGALRASFKGGSDHVSDIRRDGGEWGTTDPKALFHQHGTSRMPARPVFKLDEPARREAMRTLQRHIFGADGQGNSGLGSAILGAL
jgi:phage gpG-like protein